MPERYVRLDQYPTGVTAWVCTRCGSVVHHDYVNFHDRFHDALARLFEGHNDLVDWASRQQ